MLTQSNVNYQIASKTNDLTQVWSWDLSAVSEQFTVEHPELADSVEQIEKEYRHFIYLCAKTSENLKAPQRVDEFWHSHILNTPDYVAFSNKVSGSYIHHNRKIASENIVESIVKQYNYLISVSIQHFGKQVFNFEDVSHEKYTLESLHSNNDLTF